MSTENTVEELSEDIEVIGPGQILSEAREAMGLTQQQVADRLNFRTTLVKNIEEDNFDHSLPTTFNRGYLKNYAKLVDVSVDEILAGYEMLNVAKKQGAEMQSFSKETKKQAENNLVMWISYLILALLIGSTILWWLQDAKKSNEEKKIIKPTTSISTNLSEDDNTTELNESTQTNIDAGSSNAKTELTTLSETLKDTPNPVINEENNLPESIDTNNNLATNTEIVETTLVSNALDKAETPNEPAVAITSNEDISHENDAVDFGPIETAIFTFSGDCWVNIYDATGERIAWGIKKSGYVMNISGQAPFNITLGKPELVTIEFENQLVDMSQFNRGNIAKFTVPLS
ncbi:cytoskeleton protein RodZ [Colwellia sp. 1_MG-2023]|uniref:cytoskeleton protein RodZ n=1 Tax=Colwellia sp. 1_MG-2023 TaxID=3062649 RepID=UPI0026E1B2EE|nr:cytoskeleton protein RodZ [Colwellia sp. 1_MG-2023]MDO6446566.1 cytoskeleton protein RodZ [Colwellia sp. 1_MG-2023]